MTRFFMARFLRSQVLTSYTENTSVVTALVATALHTRFITTAIAWYITLLCVCEITYKLKFKFFNLIFTAPAFRFASPFCLGSSRLLDLNIDLLQVLWKTCLSCCLSMTLCWKPFHSRLSIKQNGARKIR